MYVQVHVWALVLPQETHADDCEQHRTDARLYSNSSCKSAGDGGSGGRNSCGDQQHIGVMVHVSTEKSIASGSMMTSHTAAAVSAITSYSTSCINTIVTITVAQTIPAADRSSPLASFSDHASGDSGRHHASATGNDSRHHASATGNDGRHHTSATGNDGRHHASATGNDGRHHVIRTQGNMVDDSDNSRRVSGGMPQSLADSMATTYTTMTLANMTPMTGACCNDADPLCCVLFVVVFGMFQEHYYIAV